MNLTESADRTAARRLLAGSLVWDNHGCMPLRPFEGSFLPQLRRYRAVGVGMVDCCTHTGPKTTLDVMAYSSKPVIFSRSNPRAVHDHPRNISDEAIIACPATGGVVCLNGIGIFLGKNDSSDETFVRHLDYVVQKVGPSQVGIGLDYVFDRQELDDFVQKNIHTFPPGMGYDAGIRMVEPEQIPTIVEQLLRRGYSDDELRAILGRNLLRDAQALWR